MLAIRMQRTGRKGHAMFRVIVQDSRRTPTSGKVVARLGSYDPHAKTITIDKEKASFYLEHGAQPSDRVASLLKAEGVKLPDWVNLVASDKKGIVRNADKRRSTRPADAVPAEEPAAPEAAAEAPVEEAPVAEATPEPAAEETPPVETESTPEAEIPKEPAEKPQAETSEPDKEPADKPEAEAEEPTASEEPEPEAQEPAKDKNDTKKS